MVLELGLTQSVIQVTPDYSNAVLSVLLPYFSDFSEKLGLNVPHPLTKGDIVNCRILPWHSNDGEIPNASIKTKQGLWLGFEFGNVNGFGWPNAYSDLQNPEHISKYYGTVTITEKKAIQLARDTITKAGIPLEDIFAEQVPQVTLPTIGTNTVARYLIEWSDPRGAIASTVRMEINGQTGQVELFYFHPQNVRKPSPKVDVVPTRGQGIFDSQIPPSVNPDYAWKLIPIMLVAVDKYARTLSLPIPRPLTTNNVAKIEILNNDGWPHAEILLTNNWRFIYRHTMVNGYYAPDNFFASDKRKIHVSEFKGKWNLGTNQAIELVKTTLSKLNFPTNNIHMDFSPRINYATGDFQKIIPRYYFEWFYENVTHDDLQSKVEAEVNADTGTVESLYYDDKAYWDSRPPIDVPISIQQ